MGLEEEQGFNNLSLEVTCISQATCNSWSFVINTFLEGEDLTHFQRKKKLVLQKGQEAKWLWSSQ